MKHYIYKRLCETKGFVSGEHLSANAGITRAALWKHINAYKDDGAIIKSVTGKGYCMVCPPTIARSEYVKAHLKSDIPVFFKDSTASTNDMAKIAAANVQNAAFIAGEQTAGRGRKGREWISGRGQGVYLSILTRPNLSAKSVSGITLMAALVVCEAIEIISSETPRIKWPNDIVMGGKKCAGILTESMINPDGVEYVICGIGINTKHKGDNVSPDAHYVNANNTLLASAVIDSYLKAHDVFIKTGIAAFMPDFRNKNAIKGNIKLTGYNEQIAGEFAGFDDEGAILIKSEGVEKRFVAGEISLRGEKGYV